MGEILLDLLEELGGSKSKKHPECKGHWVYGAEETEFECDYDGAIDITCDECLFGPYEGLIDPRIVLSQEED